MNIIKFIETLRFWNKVEKLRNLFKLMRVIRAITNTKDSFKRWAINKEIMDTNWNILKELMTMEEKQKISEYIEKIAGLRRRESEIISSIAENVKKEEEEQKDYYRN